MTFLTNNEDKRRYERIPASMVCELRNGSDPAQAMESTVRNLSPMGVFIESLDDYELGQTVELALELPRSGVRLSIVGCVRWCKESEPRGIGIEFIRVDADDEERIKKYVEWHTQQARLV